MVVENNNDTWKLAGLSKLRVGERYRLCNSLFNSGLYKIDNFKAYNYIYIPFAVNDGVEVYLDESLKRFKTVFPACGATNNAIELTIEELEKITNPVAWINVGKEK